MNSLTGVFIREDPFQQDPLLRMNYDEMAGDKLTVCEQELL